MVDADDVRAVARTLPRSEEHLVRDRVKFRVGRLVYAALSRDETVLGFAYPKDERDALVASDPETFLPPEPVDVRYNWVRVRLDRLDQAELEELLTDAWRMCVPKYVQRAYDESRTS
ncbi:MAG TPA: MmcQ/YjbR family DNA-binding protein [Mycobacteriales bacterium]|nr:MmcQ/YjbR family DNA-binding protein [Mycobacteriales bacterium]